MKGLILSLFIFMMFSMSSCSVIGDIFKAGVWVGILAIVGVIVLVFYIISKVSKK